MLKEADMPHDLTQWLPESVIYGVAVIVLVTMVVVRLAEGSKAVGDMLGPVGRWLQRRYERNEMSRREERKQEVREVLTGERAVDYQAMQRRIDVLFGLFQGAQNEIENMKSEHAINWDMTAAYLREDAQWHINAGVMMAEKGIKLPKHRSYSQFCREYRHARGIEEEEDDE